MVSIEEMKECTRCGAMVRSLSKHRRWHEHLEGTTERLPRLPGQKDGGGAFFA